MSRTHVLCLLACLLASGSCANPSSSAGDESAGGSGGAGGVAPGGSGGGPGGSGGGGTGGSGGGSGGSGGGAGGAGGVACVPACEGKQCGDDGCDGSCGPCGEGLACLPAGICERSCLPDCTGRACGDDGCDGSCGSCPPEALGCSLSGICELPCVPACEGKQCGDDGCGATCGSCAPGESCDALQLCVLDCVPACDGVTCGQDDGCGSVCGCGELHGCQQDRCVWVAQQSPFLDWSLWRSACSGQLWARWTPAYDHDLTRLEITRSDGSGWALSMPAGLPYVSGDEAIFGIGEPGRVLDSDPVYVQPTIDSGAGPQLINTLAVIPEPVLYRGGQPYTLTRVAADPVGGPLLTLSARYDGAIWGVQLFTLPDECLDLQTAPDPMVEFSAFSDFDLGVGPTTLAPGTAALLVIEGVDGATGQLTYGTVELQIP